jgi:hypothetical protein
MRLPSRELVGRSDRLVAGSIASLTAIRRGGRAFLDRARNRGLAVVRPYRVV